MTQREILKYAYYGVLECWAIEYDRLQKYPESKIAKYHEERYYAKLEEIKRMMKECTE